MYLHANPPSTAAEFWGRLITYNQIVALTGVQYEVHEHGIPSENRLIKEKDGILLDRTLFKGEIPSFIGEKETFAVGSLVWVSEDDEEGYPYLAAKTNVFQWVNEDGKKLRDLEDMRIKPLAIVSLDLDCPNTEEYRLKIEEAFDRGYPNTDWILFDTGNSFHVLFNEFVEPAELPWYFGDLIIKLSSIDSECDGSEVRRIGEEMQTNCFDRDKLRNLCHWIIDNVVHFDNPTEGKIRSVVDLRWIAHSVFELLKFLEGESNSFAFLRISKKSGLGREPRFLSDRHHERFANATTMIPNHDKVLTGGRGNRKQVWHFIK